MSSGSLRNEPAFVRWATAEGVSLVGSAVTTVVLPLVVFEATGSVTQTGVLYAMRVVPYMLFGVIAGPLADQGNRRVLIIGGNLAQGLLVATIPLAQAFGVLTVAQVYVVGLLSATAFVFGDAAVFGAVPALVGPERLSAANGFLYSLGSGAEIAGPIVGGVLAALIGPANAVWVDAASFLGAAAVQTTIRSTFRVGPRPADEPLAIRAQVGRALRFVRGQRTVATLIGVGFGNSFAFGAVLGLLVPYAVTELGLGDKDARVGLLYGATGVGALLAGMVFARLFRPERVRWLTPLTFLVSATVAAGLAVASLWVSAALLLVVFSWSISTTINVGITYRQLAAPDDLRSSVNVLGRMISWGGQPFGAACGAVVAGAASVSVAYAGAAAVMAVTGSAAVALLHRGGSTGLIAPDDASRGAQ
ncbi:MAG TPA: MFS transporter [Acidimicrobiales bacterium]